jgi:hypothetical protein
MTNMIALGDIRLNLNTKYCSYAEKLMGEKDACHACKCSR